MGELGWWVGGDDDCSQTGMSSGIYRYRQVFANYCQFCTSCQLTSWINGRVKIFLISHAHEYFIPFFFLKFIFDCKFFIFVMLSPFKSDTHSV